MHRIPRVEPAACHLAWFIQLLSNETGVHVQTQGEVDQGAAMLSDDVRDKGYALMCMSTPLSDVVIQEVTEAEILDQQLGE